MSCLGSHFSLGWLRALNNWGRLKFILCNDFGFYLDLRRTLELTPALFHFSLIFAFNRVIFLQLSRRFLVAHMRFISFGLIVLIT